MLDTLRHVETPEGVELTLVVAGPFARAQAWAIDSAIKFALLIAAGTITAVFRSLGQGVFFVFLFLLTWFYSVVFEVFARGATPGKLALGLRVVHDNGTPVGWSASVIRSLVGFIDALPFTYGVGLASVLLHPSFKRLGDLAAGTLVVHVPARAQRRRARHERPAAPPFPLRPQEQRALIEFADRADLLTTDRQEELAALVPPLSGRDSKTAVARLRSYASWLQGTR